MDLHKNSKPCSFYTPYFLVYECGKKYYYDCTSQEIADHLQMTPTAVRTRCRRALARLRSKLTALGIDAT